MKILLVGASGTLGKRLFEAFSSRHEVLRASATRSDVLVDFTDPASVKAFYEQAGAFDALIAVAGSGYIGPFSQTTEEHFYKGIRSKMMGQINLVLHGQHYINPGGSFTLTSGILADDPIRGGAVLTAINCAVNGFVLAASGELVTKGVRINAVSPGMVEDSVEELGPLFPGHTPVAMHRVIDAYVKSVEGIRTGEIIKVH
ncbi:MAG: short chain dehydrogenase [Cytophagales bacterium]|nr:short chain dehydrogenase [Cytophagales bacterium]